MERRGKQLPEVRFRLVEILPGAPNAEAGKEDKESKLRRAAVGQSAELQKAVASLVRKLLPHQVFVLSHGTIEDYAGMSESGKGKYIEIAKWICQGSQPIKHADEIQGILQRFTGRGLTA